MTQVRVRIDEGASPQPILLWDSVWNPAEGCADWAIASASEGLNRGGLQATSALATAVTNALFTNRRCPDDHPLRYLAGDDLQGWWGDGIDVRADLGEQPEGSLLWLLERAPLTRDIVERWAPTFVQDALAPLVSQGAVVRIETDVAANELTSRLEIYVRLFGRDGTKIFDARFDAVWLQLR